MVKDFRTTTPLLALVLETVQLCPVVLGQEDMKRKNGTSQNTYVQQDLIYPQSKHALLMDFILTNAFISSYSF